MALRFYSTGKNAPHASLKEAVLQGLAPDGGLYLPEALPQIDLERIQHLSFQELSYEIAKTLLHQDIPPQELRQVISKAFTFDAPLAKLEEQLYALELFHGPTLSFKDFGACFMSQLMSYLLRDSEQAYHILVATSGDTGSAVAHGFYGVPGIKVWVLYPKGQVTNIQEKQLTTLGGNVTALEVEGSFDDCQAMVKSAFKDQELAKEIHLTSANSINIARLIPQSFYYFYAYTQLKKESGPVVISVPSGNFGNLAAGVLAKRMGLPVHRFVAATNINDEVPRYLKTGVFQTHPSKHTISNAMDVGNPSNFARLLSLYDNSIEKMRAEIFGARFTDAETKAGILTLYSKYRYTADPHGSVGYLGLWEYARKFPGETRIFLETAHPAKFIEIVQPLIGRKIEIPERLQAVVDKEKKTVLLSNNYQDLKNLLISHK
jgi:threonine synthase